jgi:hypothetical protein
MRIPAVNGEALGEGQGPRRRPPAGGGLAGREIVGDRMSGIVGDRSRGDPTGPCGFARVRAGSRVDPRPEGARLWGRVRVRDEGRPQGAASPFVKSSATACRESSATHWPGRPRRAAFVRRSDPPPEPRRLRRGGREITGSPTTGIIGHRPRESSATALGNRRPPPSGIAGHRPRSSPATAVGNRRPPPSVIAGHRPRSSPATALGHRRPPPSRIVGPPLARRPPAGDLRLGL